MSKQTLYAKPLALTEAHYHRLEADSIGVCRHCRHQQGGCEPDAHGITCEACRLPAVDGIETLLECGHLEIT